MPPPPPPPNCFPFSKNKTGRRLSWSSAEASSYRHSIDRQHSGGAYYPPAESITFHSDSEMYDDVPEMFDPAKDSKDKPKLARGNTMTGTKKSTFSNRWGGFGKKDSRTAPEAHHDPEPTPLPIYKGVSRHNSRSTQASRSTQRSQDSQKTITSQQSRTTHRSNSTRSTAPKPRPPLMPQDSTSTLVGSALQRKIDDVGSIREPPNTTQRLEDLRKLMEKDKLDF